MTYNQWYNKYIDLKPVGEGTWKVDTEGRIVPTLQITDKGHFKPKTKSKPNDVIVHYERNGQRDYDIYDSHGFMTMQIHCGDHGFPKTHPYGIKGEHMAVWKWEHKNGKWIGKPTENQELTSQAREWVKDALY